MKKNRVIILGVICIILGFFNNSSNFIPANVKYAVGISLLVYSLFYKVNNDK